MVTPHAVELACSLIQSHFGEIVRKVCSCVISKGQASFPEIVRFTELSSSQVRNCLLILIQHNCVQAFKVVVQAGVENSKTSTKYIALVDYILHRLRFPKFLHVVEKDLGGEAEQLLLGFLEHGRLTLEQLIQRAAGRANKVQSEVAASVRETFGAIARAHYVERCPAPEPLVLPKSATEAPKKAARGAARGKAALAAANQLESEEQRICSAAAPLEAERFRLPASLTGPPVNENAPGDDDAFEVGLKRKRDALAMDAQTMALVDEKEVLWRVNFEAFMRRFRLEACTTQIRARIDAGAGTVFAAMVELLNGQENTSATQKFSAALALDDIVTAARKSKEGQDLSMERIRGALQMMSAQSVGYVTRLGDMRYTINFYKILEAARRNEVEGIVLQRFGRESCRIYRLLAMKGHLDQKQIADNTLLTVKDARERLYNLYKEEYISLQEVPKTADRAPSKTMYLWHVNYSLTFARVRDDMAHAAFNLCQRLQYELEQEKEVIELARRQQQLANQAAVATQIHVSDNQLKRATRIKKVALVLESSLIRLDDSIMLFHNF